MRKMLEKNFEEQNDPFWEEILQRETNLEKKPALTNLGNYLLGWKKSGNSKSILFSLILSIGSFVY